jgi:hypothetical protein
MSIACDDNGEFFIHHWPPLPIEDSVIILHMLQVSRPVFDENLVDHVHSIDVQHVALFSVLL